MQHCHPIAPHAQYFFMPITGKRNHRGIKNNTDSTKEDLVPSCSSKSSIASLLLLRRAIFLLFFYFLFCKSFLQELSEPQCWKREPKSLPMVAETCLQLHAGSHFWKLFISKNLVV